jgi:hypothetical protein
VPFTFGHHAFDTARRELLRGGASACVQPTMRPASKRGLGSWRKGGGSPNIQALEQVLNNGRAASRHGKTARKSFGK